MRRSALQHWCVILCAALLFQSCQVYRKNSITIDEATNAKKVLVERNNLPDLHLSKIERIDTKYYGTARVKGETVKIQLDTTEIKTIRPLNRSATTWANIGLFGGPLIVITAIIIINDQTKWKGDTYDLGY